MKKYAVYALPSLLALFALLFWLHNTSEKAPKTHNIPISQVVNVDKPETQQAYLEGDPMAPSVALDEQSIADSDSLTTTVLVNTQIDDATKEDSASSGPDISDSAVQSYITEQLDAAVTPWLSKEHLLSKFARAINALEEGKLVSKYRPLEMPIKPFVAQKHGDAWLIPQSNYARYTPYITTLESLSEDTLLKAYEYYYPALEQAYQDLGVDKGDFKQVTVRALKQLLAAPELATSPELSHKSVMYTFTNKDLEALPEAQKLMIRMGPDNSRRLKALIKKILVQME